jgi:signal transduction histidine kinase
VLRLLLDNAVKFTDAGYIRVACLVLSDGPDSADIQISIEDTGIGIAPEMHDFVFQKFTQADGSLTRRHGGTGMGLALAKEIVEWMNGKIGVESCIGRGSRFWFALTFAKTKLLLPADLTPTHAERLV